MLLFTLGGISVYVPLRIFPTTTVNFEGVSPCRLYRCQQSFSPNGANLLLRFLFGMIVLPFLHRAPHLPALCITEL
jgi:hypothetical protein